VNRRRFALLRALLGAASLSLLSSFWVEPLRGQAQAGALERLPLTLTAANGNVTHRH